MDINTSTNKNCVISVSSEFHRRYITMTTKFKYFTALKLQGVSGLWFCTTVLAFLMIILNSPGCSSPEKKLEEARNFSAKGRDSYLLFSPKGAEKAIHLYEKAIDIDDNYAPAYAGLGEAYSFLGLWNQQSFVEKDNKLLEKSLSYSQKALELDQNSSVSHRALAASYRGLGRFEDATKEARKAIELNPNDAEAYYILWTVSGADPNSKYVKKALELNPDLSIAYNDLGYIYFTKGIYDKADENLNRAIEANPELIQAHVNLGLTLAAQNRLKESEEQYRTAIKLNPDYLLGHYNLGIVLAKQGKFDEAIDEFEKAIDISPDFPEPHIALAFAYESKGDNNNAVKQYNKFIGLASVDKAKYGKIVAEAKDRIKRINGKGS
jgi:tetratricopeptide (TPR) repeat protein